MPVRFDLYGPYQLTPTSYRRGVALDASCIDSFWEAVPGEIRARQGVYVFALRRARGYTPYYVGKTTQQDFLRETFTDRNIVAYHGVIVREVGTPVFFFLRAQRRRGPLNQNVVLTLESDLIPMAYAKNPDGLINRQHARSTVVYEIPGVLNSGRGRPTQLQTSFKSMMGID